METTVSSPSWQRSFHQPRFDQTIGDSGHHGRGGNSELLFEEQASHDNRSLASEGRRSYGRPSWVQEELVSDRNDFVRRHQYVSPAVKVTTAVPLARHYHQHEEDWTEFRSQTVKASSQQQKDNEFMNESLSAGSAESALSELRHSLYSDGHGAYTGSDMCDQFSLNNTHGRYNPDEYAGMAEREVGNSVPPISSHGHPMEGGYKQGGVRDFADEEYGSEEEDTEEKFYHEDFADDNWQREYNDNQEPANWKRPDMHMFKASSYKGSVASDKSSRLDPHTYQSYAAGLLYSSGRSEKFLKLQKHFAVLERIGELDKSSTEKETTADAQNSQWQELGSSRQNFHSQEEMQELYTELKEAKKKKEFFYDTDKKDQVMWSPEKDFGLKNREHTLRDQVRTYRNLVEDKTSKSSSTLASRPDEMKRSVSFGHLYEKFHTSESPDQSQKSAKSSAKSHGVDTKIEAAGVQSAASLPSPRIKSANSSALKQAVPCSSSVSYLQLMESAAKKSRQRAVHGTHLDSPCNEYESYVKEMRKVSKENSDLSFHSTHKSSYRPRFSEAQASHESGGLAIVVDSSVTPSPQLKVKAEHSNKKVMVPLSSTVGSAMQPEAKQVNSLSPEGEQLGDYVDVNSTGTAQSETSVGRPIYSEMPDILQMDKHHRPFKNSTAKDELFKTTLPKSSNPDSRKRLPFASDVHANPDTENRQEHDSQEKQTQRLQNKEHSNPQENVAVNRPRPSDKVAVFQVRNLRNLAENNEFSVNQLSWMKKSQGGHVERDVGYRNGAQAAGPHETTGKGRNVVESARASVPKFSPNKSSDIFVPQDSSASAQHAPSTQARFAAPSEFNSKVTSAAWKPSTAPKMSEPLHFQPRPSQCGPAFSTSKRGNELRTKQSESPRHGGVISETAPTHSQYSPNSGHTDKQPGLPGSHRGIKQSENMNMNVSSQKKEATYSQVEGQRLDRESEHKDVATGRRPGDGSDSQSPDKQYGQLRKWTAVADIYRDVEKSWSPTRETRPFPIENNSSISSTDTFIVKDTDGEQDDLESSVSSVSRLRQIFERQQKVSKSKSEPDVSQDMIDEPRRPRSAKSQADLSAFNKEEESNFRGISRTVSGDLREIRHRYQDRTYHGDGQFPDTEIEDSHPTDIALKAWVHYTGRPKYDPYLPPEDILKEVSAASTGRKLDVPRPKTYRPSNVSRMTLEYFNQIGSEWQRSNYKSDIPQNFQSAFVHEAVPTQPNIQHVDRRYVSHQYVNEDLSFTSNYPQTDDLKLKQSQWAGASGFGREAEPQYYPQRMPGNADVRAGYSAEEHGSAVSQSWAPPVPYTSGPIKTLTKNYESKPSHMSERPSQLLSDSAMRQQASQPQTNMKPPTPAQRSSSQSWRVQMPQTVNRDTRSQPWTREAANSPSQTISPTNASPAASKQPLSMWREDRKQKRSPEEGSLPPQPGKPVPPEPARMPPVSPVVQKQHPPRPQPRGLQHARSKSSDSEHSSGGDFGAVYCVSTGSVLYGLEADEEEPAPPPPPPQPSQLSSSATFPRKNAARQPHLQPAPQGSRGSPGGSYSAPRNPASSAAATSAPAPPTRGGSGLGGAVQGAGSTLPLSRTKPFPSRGSSLSAAEQLGVKSPPPSSAGAAGFVSGVSASSGTSASNPIPSAGAAFKHQTSDERRLRPEPVNPEKERRRREEEEAYRKKRLEELYEEERLKKMKKDEADAEARRHHDFYTSNQKSPISPNRFDDAPSSLSPSTPGSLGTLERKGPPLSVPPERRRGFQIQGKARALFNFTAQNPRELPFRKNDIIYLLRQVDKNWFEGERHGRVGIFPTNYVEVVTSIEAAQAAAMQAEGQGRTKYSFTAQSSVELSLRKGEFVVLLRRVDENWYEGRMGNRQGIFPVSYVEIMREPSTPLITPAPSVITTPMTGTPEMLSPVGYDPAPTPPPQPSPSALSHHRSPYGYPPAQQAGYSPGSGSLLTPATSASRQQFSFGRHEQDFIDSRSPAANTKSSLSPGRQMGSPGRRTSPGLSPGAGPGTSRLQVDIQSMAKPYANGPPAASSSASKVMDDDLALTRYRALYAYRPQNEDELELREGDEVFVMEKCDDGWFVGTSARTGCFGTFPGNYVQKIFEHQGRVCYRTEKRGRDMVLLWPASESASRRAGEQQH